MPSLSLLCLSKRKANASLSISLFLTHHTTLLYYVFDFLITSLSLILYFSLHVTASNLISSSPNTFNFLTITHHTQEKMRGAMKDKGKAVATSSTSSNWFSDYYPSYELPCKKHPSSSSVGICAYCLKDRLIKLVCSDCGEQRLSSCSCSDISSSYPNSCTVDIGSVGRISFLIENDKDGDSHSLSNVKSGSELRSEAAALLKRSSSTSTSVVDIKKGGFWRLGRLFRKKRERDNNVDEKSEMWDAENMGLSRSRSVCEGSFNISTGRPSDINSLVDSEKRNSGFSGIHPPSTSSFNGVKREGSLLNDFKGVDKGSFIEFDGSFNGGDDPGFINLKLSLASESKPEFSCLRGSNFLESESGCRISRDCDPSGLRSQSFGCLRGDGVFRNGSSCRITVNNNEAKKCKKSFKVWKWIVKHHSSIAGRPSTKKGEEHDFNY